MLMLKLELEFGVVRPGPSRSEARYLKGTAG